MLQLLTPSMNHHNRVRCQKQIIRACSAVHLPITALRCCHGSSSGNKTTLLSIKRKGRISLNLERLRNCSINLGLPLTFAFTCLSCLLCLPKAPSNTIGFFGHLPGKVALKILLRHSVHVSTGPCVVIDLWVAPVDQTIQYGAIFISSLCGPAFPTM